jgi:hypothetical protein
MEIIEIMYNNYFQIVQTLYIMWRLIFNSNMKNSKINYCE